MSDILHIWFDFSDTIGLINREIYNDILYSSYAKAVRKPLNDELKKEYAESFKKYKSNSAVFASLGLPAGHLADCISVVEPRKLYSLTDADIPDVLRTLKERRPISIFSNNKLDVILPALGIEISWFTHILGPDSISKPKPALDGFYKMIELSGVESSQMLYVGDDVHKDLLPAKEVGIRTGLLWKESPEADFCFKNFKAILDMFAE